MRIRPHAPTPSPVLDPSRARRPGPHVTDLGTRDGETGDLVPCRLR